MKQLFLTLTVVWAVTIQAQTEGGRLGKLLYPEMVLVEGGTFVMGDTEMEGDADEQPAHEVTLKSFSIAKTETTVLQYKTFCNATGRTFPNEMADEVNDAPMTYVSWHEQWLILTGWQTRPVKTIGYLPKQNGNMLLEEEIKVKVINTVADVASML